MKTLFSAFAVLAFAGVASAAPPSFAPGEYNPTGSQSSKVYYPGTATIEHGYRNTIDTSKMHRPPQKFPQMRPFPKPRPYPSHTPYLPPHLRPGVILN